MARNDDRARDRRAKRRGEDPSGAQPGPESTSPAPGEAADDASLSDTQRAENESRQGVVGAPVDLGGVEGAPGSDLDPAPGGEVVGGEVTTGGGRALRFFRASWAELQRVRWPNRQQVAQGTAVTLGFVVIAGIYLGIADAAANAVVNFILGT